jgi:photosystem II stability/assembly factor-like uncharacterized protein
MAAAADESAWEKIDANTVNPPVIGAWWSTATKLHRIVALPDGKTLIAVGDGWTIARSNDGGSTWTWGVLNGPYAHLSGEWRSHSNLSGVTVLADGKSLVAVGEDGMAFCGDDAGITWDGPIPVYGGFLQNIDVVALPGGKTVIAVGTGAWGVGVVVRSRDGGRHWETVRTGGAQEHESLSGVVVLADGKTVVAIGGFGGGVAVRSRDGGEHWDPPQHITATPFRLVALPDGRTLVAVGWHGEVMRSHDGGEHWDQSIRAGLADLRGVTALPDGKTVVAVGTGGVVVRSLDGGEHWNEPRQISGITPDLSDVVAAPRGLIAVGSHGSLFDSGDGGLT